jgi:hypothetical protein
MGDGKNRIGLGYRDADGAVTHCVWMRAKDMESGPYWVEFFCYRTGEELLELLSVIRSLGDQVRLVSMMKPAGFQLQDLLRQPHLHQQVTRGGKYEAGNRAHAPFQFRILDLEACMEKTLLTGPELRFNLSLSDPIERFLPEDSPWRGVGRDYVVTLGPSSGAEVGTIGALPTLEASIGAFTRLWMGVAPASSLALTDDLNGPPDLLKALNNTLHLPPPEPEWDF